MGHRVNLLFCICLSVILVASAARLPNYGVWKGTATFFSAPRSPSGRTALLTIRDGKTYHTSPVPTPPPNINILATLSMEAPEIYDTRIVYWIDRNFTASLVSDSFLLANLKPGYHNIPSTEEDPHSVPGLDMVADGHIDMRKGVFGIHNAPGHFTDVKDVMKSFFDPAIEAQADIWVWGQRGENGKGFVMHHVQMNQGHSGTLAEENGRGQDGGVIVRYYDHWEALFIAFPQQAAITDEAGEPVGDVLANIVGRG
ncbi:Uncharacterized protein CGCS363_v012766 [Colletotrichum siamense]|uniref:Uncharacterized protein n=1 Tax=Colletotrichum siamense TaxID=690259 RepID=UPI0018721A22|nr:Uncharacterized protein CGCS363_v012766 [Colletotrichum siamense]KAF5489081.1 Uncharacterized protein CGCS363_v012766 [Colletotrichum siamense]